MEYCSGRYPVLHKEALFQAIIHNAILSEEEIHDIKAELSKKIKRK